MALPQYSIDWLGSAVESYQMASSDDDANSFRIASWLELKIRLWLQSPNVLFTLISSKVQGLFYSDKIEEIFFY